MRLTPIETPANPFVRLMYWAAAPPVRQGHHAAEGDLRAASRARSPAQLGIYCGLGAGLPASSPTCSSCCSTRRGAERLQLLRRHRPRDGGAPWRVPLEKIDAVAEWRTSPLFTGASVPRSPTSRRRRATSASPTRRSRRSARTSTSEQIVAITWLNAVENYFNLLNGPLGIESDGLCAIAEGRRAPRRDAGGAIPSPRPGEPPAAGAQRSRSASRSK